MMRILRMSLFHKIAVMFAILLSILISVAPSYADEFTDGKAALDQSDYATAFPKMLTAATNGNAEAQAYVGMMYEKGQGVPQDYAEAVRWYRMSADQGNALGLSNLGEGKCLCSGEHD